MTHAEFLTLIDERFDDGKRYPTLDEWAEALRVVRLLQIKRDTDALIQFIIVHDAAPRSPVPRHPARPAPEASAHPEAPLVGPE